MKKTKEITTNEWFQLARILDIRGYGMSHINHKEIAIFNPKGEPKAVYSKKSPESGELSFLKDYLWLTEEIDDGAYKIRCFDLTTSSR